MNDQPIKRRLFWLWLLLISLMGILIPTILRASVGIVYFRGVGGLDFIRLEWRTEAEIDFAGFLLYRGLTDNLSQATQIGPFIPAQGQPPTGGADYQYMDTTVTEGVIYYYWLGQVDLNQNVPGEYEGPVIISTSGGTTINTPVPTTPGQASPTPTYTSVPGSPTFTVTPMPTSGNGSAATTTPSPQPTTTSQQAPTAIPGGTFPQPPTPTRFAFSSTPDAGIPATPAVTSVETGGSIDTGSSSEGSLTPPDPGSEPVLPPPSDSLSGQPVPGGTVSELSATATPVQEIAVLGGDNVIRPLAASAEVLPPPPGSESRTPTPARRTSSPLLLMGLLVAGVFTLGGMITTAFLLVKKDK
ncbi:MAG: hypothetical protein KJ063_10960 [Anaerolineae bacterium]|nr:hypothetical protein [Anaerolineae bacterium]